MSKNFIVGGTIVDVLSERMFRGTIEIRDGRIFSINEKEDVPDRIILPGLIDAHIHIESSMLVPSEFARIAVTHGTVATVSDPHEIANVLGIEGINFMLTNSKQVPFKFYFGAPSCVPATSFESSGAELGADKLDILLRKPEIRYLSEMMNFPGVLYHDPEVAAKLALAKKYGKPVDGHAPGLKGELARAYIEAGISTDHECFTIDEAEEKIGYGMKILIREGSAAKNFDALIPLISNYPDKIMLCSDDKHPDDLIEGHINLLVKRAIRLGYKPMDVIRSCTFNPVNHYHLDTGLLQLNDPADFIIVDNLENFRIESTFIDGIEVAAKGRSLIPEIESEPPNKFVAEKIAVEDIAVRAESNEMNVIEALDGQLITHWIKMPVRTENGNVVSDTINDCLKLIVMNRYQKSKPSIGFIRGFGLKNGALASTVAHDSHNIIAIGTNDEEIVEAINLLIESKGGICLVGDEGRIHLPLPVGGIMTNQNGTQVAERYKTINEVAKKLGSSLTAPYMTLSFMALLVIPELKLSDKGLFNGNKFEFTSLF